MAQQSVAPSVGDATKQSFAGAVVADIDAIFYKVDSITSVDSPHTPASANTLIEVDTSGGAITIALPPVAGMEGLGYVIHLATAGNDLTIDPNSAEQFSDVFATKVYESAGQVLQIISDGNVWVTTNRMILNYGELFGSTNTETISVIDTYVVVTALDSFGEIRGMSLDAATNHDITVNRTGYYRVSYSAAISGAASKAVTMAVHVDGVEKVQTRRRTGSVDGGVLACVALVLLTAGEAVDLRVQNNTDTVDIVILDCNLVAELVDSDRN